MIRNMIMPFVIAFLVIYGLIVAFVATHQERLVFHPDYSDAFGHDLPVPFTVVTTTTEDGLILKGFYAPPAADKPVLVYFHGNAGHVFHRMYKTAEPIKEGYGMLMVEYRRYGGNPGLPTEDGLYKDARAWIKFLTSQNITPDRMVYYGESLGTGVAVQMATEIPPKAIILEAPFTSVTDVGAFYYRFLPVRLLAKYHFNSFAKAPSLTMPTLIYHGTRDIVVPLRFGKKLYETIPDGQKKMVIVDKAGHGNLYDYGASGIIMGFLHDHAP